LYEQVRKNPGSSKLQDDLKLLRKKIKRKIRHEAKEQGLKALVSKNPESRGTSTWPLLLLKPVMILFLHSLLSMNILHL